MGTFEHMRLRSQDDRSTWRRIVSVAVRKGGGWLVVWAGGTLCTTTITVRAFEPHPLARLTLARQPTSIR